MLGILPRRLCRIILIVGCSYTPSLGTVLAVGDLIVSDQNVTGTSNPDGRIIRVDPTTGTQTLIASGVLLADPTAAALEPSGTLIVADVNAQGDGALIRVNPVTGAQTLLSSENLMHSPIGVGVGPTGQIYVAQQGGAGRLPGLLRVDPVSGAQTAFSLGGLFRVAGNIAFASSGDLLVSDAQARGGGVGAVIRVNPVTGAQSFVSTGPLEFPFGIAVEPDGQIIVSEGGRITRVDPVTGASSVLSSGGNLTLPSDVDVDLDGALRVADQEAAEGSGALIMIDRMTGAQSIEFSGGFFNNPTGVFTIPEPACPGCAIAPIGVAFARRRRVTPRIGLPVTAATHVIGA
jgi:streptogramin lyase